MSITLALQDHVPRSALQGARRWLYAGDDPVFDLPELERVSMADAKAAVTRELRTPYLDAIGALSRANASPEWWASHLAAKQPYPSLFSRVCGVASARELAGDGTLVVCSTPAQLRVLHRLLAGSAMAGPGIRGRRRAALRTGVRVAWPSLQAAGERLPDSVLARLAASSGTIRFALERTAGYRRRTLQALGARPLGRFEGEATALLVTWIDGRSFRGSGFQDPHLGPLAPMLRDRGLRVVNLVKVLPHVPFAACSEAMLAGGEPAVFPDLYIAADDLRTSARRVAAWRPAIDDGIRVGGVPFAGIAREYLSEHRRGQADALLQDLLVSRLAGEGARPGLVVFPWEGHAWEQVLIAAVHRWMPGTSVVGYDNLNFSSLALSLYPSELEVDLRPLPDRVVTNGSTFAQVLGASAFPRDRIRVGCAMRHAGMDTHRPRPDHPAGFVLAACSIDAGQSIELLRKASAAFGDQLVARLHPSSDAAAIRAAVPSVRCSEESLAALLPDARLMLYTYSVVAYEALAAGTPPVFVRSESMLDADQLEPTPEVRWVARTPEQLRAVAQEIDALPDYPAWRRRAQEVVLAALRPLRADCVDAFLA